MKKIANYCVLAGLGAVLGMGCRKTGDPGRQLTLAEGGKTEYVVVAPENPSEVDAFGIKELTSALGEATGAEFKSVPARDAAKYAKRIFVGAGPAGAKSDLAGMEDQDSVCESSGADVCLYGKGIHGNLYAVYDFLEGQIGCRWFSVFAKPYIPKRDPLRLAAFKKQTRPDFKYRDTNSDIFLLRPEGPLFLYRNRLNMGLERKTNHISGVVDEVNSLEPTAHTIFCYIPPTETPLPGHGINPPLKSLKNKNYFATNPEFFTLDENGKRVMARQLCFSNKELRRELTANIEANIQAQGGKGIVNVSQNDNALRFCCCADCARLEKKLGCPGGPMFDYIIELCGYLKDKYPGVMVRTYAYNKGQSQEPPTKIEKLPGNMMVIFAAINDNMAQDWNHPTNLKSFQDLAQWVRICPNVWVWYYHFFENRAPFCNTYRFVNDMRVMKTLGVSGLFVEKHKSFPEQGFAELQTYMMLKLSQSVGQDSGALISEFMDLQYGKAGAAMRKYHDELEECRKDKTLGYIPEINAFTTAMLPYLTAANLLRWELQFDEMETLTKDDPAKLFNVRATRCPLDLVVLEKWQKVRKAFPDYFQDAKLFEGRVRSTYDRMLATHVSKKTLYPGAGEFNMKHAYARLDASLAALDANLLSEPAGGKPIPAQFAGIPKELIRRVVPKSGVKPQVSDPDAAFGIAAESVPVNPFVVGFCNLMDRTKGMQRNLPISEITTSGYQIYKVAGVDLSPNCYWWCGDWNVQAKLGQFFEEDGNNKWDIYASLKFEGPMYFKDSNAKDNRVLCDQVILIKADGPK